MIPTSLWIVLFFIAGAIFAYMLFFADRGERWFAQSMLMGSVVAVITATMLLIHFLDSPVRPHGGLQPVAMKRTLRILAQERRDAGDRTRLPATRAGPPDESPRPRRVVTRLGGSMFFALSTWQVALLVLAVIGAATAAGHVSGRYLREHSDDAPRAVRGAAGRAARASSA